MSIAQAAMIERRFARALFVSLLVHAVVFYTLGGLRPRAPSLPESLPLQVRLLNPAPVAQIQTAEAPQPAVIPERVEALPRPKPERQLRVERSRLHMPRQPRAATPALPTPAPAPPETVAQPEPQQPAAPLEVAPPPVATAPPSAAVLPQPRTDRQALRASFGRGVEEAIEAAKSYPRIARDRGWQGTVRVRLRFLPGGGVDQIAVVDSSGFPLLDEHAVRMARAAELPRVPGALTAEPFELDVPIRFRLRG